MLELSSSHLQFLEAGLRLYPNYGYHKLSVRVLAAETGLSSGMFHHLFENKDDFIFKMLTLHDECSTHFAPIHEPTEPTVQLRAALRALAMNVRTNLPWLRRMLTDCADGATVVADYLRARSHEHIEYMEYLLRQCVPTTSERVFLWQLNFVMSATTAPILFTSQFEQLGVLPARVLDALPEFLSDDAIEQRLDWTFQALNLPNH